MLDDAIVATVRGRADNTQPQRHSADGGLKRVLFIAWQDTESRRWFPIGRLQIFHNAPRYCFAYIQGALQAHEETGFPPLLEFPEFKRPYIADDLFPFFQNRLLSRSRKDSSSYLRNLDLPDGVDPIEVFAVGGGTRATDSFEIFPKLEPRGDGSFSCRFFLHGWQYMNEASRSRLDRLVPGDRLGLAAELANPINAISLQIQSDDRFILGWAPRYLVSDLVRALLSSPQHCTAQVVRLNPMPAPSRQRLLIELAGKWPTTEPMSDQEFQPINA